MHLSEAALIEKNDGEQKPIIGGQYSYHNVITMDGSEPYMMPHKSPLTLDTYVYDLSG